MFIIEKFKADHDARVEQWKRNREKWVDSHDYYSRNDYEDRYPRPGYFIKQILKAVLILAFISLIFVLIFSVAREIKQNNDKKSKEAITQTGENNCKNFNKNDYVRIQWGDFKNTNGTIIGGCEKGDNYQVKIDDGSKADITSDGNDIIDVGGWIISVDQSDNLVKIELPNKEKS